MVGADQSKKLVVKVYPQMVSISHCVNTAVGTTVLNSGPLNHLFSFFLVRETTHDTHDAILAEQSVSSRCFAFLRSGS